MLYVLDMHRRSSPPSRSLDHEINVEKEGDTSESAASMGPSYSSQRPDSNTLRLLHSLGLEPKDLSLLAQLPEDVLTLESLPHLLTQIKGKKRTIKPYASHNLQKKVVDKVGENERIMDDNKELTEKTAKIAEEMKTKNKELKNVEKKHFSSTTSSMSQNYPYRGPAKDSRPNLGTYGSSDRLHPEDYHFHRQSQEPSSHSSSSTSYPSSSSSRASMGPSYSSQRPDSNTLSLLDSFGLEPKDLSLLADLPEDVLTLESLPHLLTQIKGKKRTIKPYARPEDQAGNPKDDRKTGQHPNQRSYRHPNKKTQKKAVLRTAEEFQGRAKPLVENKDWTRDPPPPEQLQDLLGQGASLPVEVPECDQEQGRWLGEVRLALGPEGGDTGGVTLAVLRNLMEAGGNVPQSVSVETVMAELQELLTIAERCEEKAQICLEKRQKHPMSTLEAKVSKAQLIPVKHPKFLSLQDRLSRVRAWVTDLEEIRINRLSTGSHDGSSDAGVSGSLS